MPDSLPGAAFWEALGWTPEPAQLGQLKALQDLLRSWNSRVNLTRLVAVSYTHLTLPTKRIV